MAEKNGHVTDSEPREERLMNPEVDIISMPRQELSIEKEIAAIEKNVQFYNRVKVVALKMTRAADWVDMGGPYLQDRGAESIAIAFGVDITEDPPRMEWAEDDKGRYYMFIAAGRAFSKKLGRFVEDVGVCSQRDKFFGKVGTEFKEMHDVDMPNIIRKAVTNLHNRLIKRVIGLMGVTWEDLAEAGIDRKLIQKVDYKEGGKKAEAAAKLSEDALKKRDDIWRMLMEIAVGDVAVAKSLLKTATTFKGDDGKERSVEDIARLTSERWILSLHKKIKAEYDSVMAKREKGEAA